MQDHAVALGQTAQRLPRFGLAGAEAIGNLVDGIDALCGGVRQCATCHVYVDDEWAARVGPPGDDEAEMLEALADVIEVKPTSRLSCQIHITEELDGLRVHIPKDQPGI